MKRTLLLLLLFLSTYTKMNAQSTSNGHYADVNGLKLYYEIHGAGYPLVLLHGGGSTIQSTYGNVLPELAKKYKVIAVELQAHGRTLDIDRPLSFEQDADDIAALMKQLHITKANFLGFSNGGTTCIQIAIRHSSIVNKLVLASALFQRSGMIQGFFDGFDNVKISDMPQPLTAAFLKVNPDTSGLQHMFDRDVARMKNFKDISDSLVKNIQASTLVINGSKDVVRPEHAIEISRMIPHSELLITPGGHGDYIGEVCSARNENLIKATLLVIEEFLKE